MGIFAPPEDIIAKSFCGASRENEYSHVVGNVVYGVCQVIEKLITRYRVRGRENLRAFAGRGGCVVVCNHISVLDVAFLWCAARPSQWIRFMARDTLFQAGHGLGGWIASRLGGFPVKRDSADRTSLKTAARMLKNHEIVGIFPEGTRRGRGSATPRLHAGAALVARMGRAPMLPSTVVNADKVRIKGEPFIHFPTVTVKFGEPVYLDQFGFLPKDELLEGATWYVMRECFALARDCAPAEVDMVELFPETKDYAPVFAAHPLEAHRERGAAPDAKALA